MTSIPSNKLCQEVNPELWAQFCKRYALLLGGHEPVTAWTEEEVVQYLDLLDNPSDEEIKYLDDAADEAEYYQQFG